MTQVDDRDEDEDGCQGSEESGIPTAAESYIEHRAKDDSPEIRRQGHRRDPGDSRLRNMARRQHLGYGEKGYAAVKPEGSIREAHEPDRWNTAMGFHASLQGLFMLSGFL